MTLKRNWATLILSWNTFFNNPGPFAHFRMVYFHDWYTFDTLWCSSAWQVDLPTVGLKTRKIIFTGQHPMISSQLTSAHFDYLFCMYLVNFGSFKLVFLRVMACLLRKVDLSLCHFSVFHMYLGSDADSRPWTTMKGDYRYVPCQRPSVRIVICSLTMEKNEKPGT